MLANGGSVGQRRKCNLSLERAHKEETFQREEANTPGNST
jgi:hypothetical protein